MMNLFEGSKVLKENVRLRKWKNSISFLCFKLWTHVSRNMIVFFFMVDTMTKRSQPFRMTFILILFEVYD